MSFNRAFRILALGLALVPAAFAFTRWPLSELPLAQACSGTGNVPQPDGWHSLSLQAAESATVSVATDGFFVLSGSTRGLSAQDALGSIVVAVTTPDGAAVAGEPTLLKDEGKGYFLFGWTAAAPLEAGTKLKLAYSVPSASFMAGGEQELEVVGSPTPLPTPDLSLDGWVDFGHGVGEATSCTRGAGGSCGDLGGGSLELPGAEEQRRAVETWWNKPSVNGFVAWQARVELSSKDPGAILPRGLPSMFYGPASSVEGMGLLVFPNAPADYCATLIVRDLRTGTESKSETCGTPQPPVRTELDYPLSSCTSPPNQALTERWCAMHPGSSLPECQPSTGTAGSGLGGSSAGGPAAPAAASERDSRTSSGCQHAGPASAGAIGSLLALASLVLLGRRRRAGVR